MTPIDQMRLCGLTHPLSVDERAYLVSQVARHARVAHSRKQKVQKQICERLGLDRFPGRGVLEAVLAGRDYVSPGMAGIVMHTIFDGNADLYHAVQVQSAIAHWSASK